MRPLLVALVLWPSLAAAQALPVDRLTPALPTAAERQAADIASWATALTAIVLDTRASFACPERRPCFEKQALRIGLVYGPAYVVKMLVRRQRPCAPTCGVDDPRASFFSAHTAIAFSTVGGASVSLTLPLAVSTGGLRIAAGKHYLTDVLAGAAEGWLVSRLR